jgi:hypothetical protein
MKHLLLPRRKEFLGFDQFVGRSFTDLESHRRNLFQQRVDGCAIDTVSLQLLHDFLFELNRTVAQIARIASEVVDECPDPFPFFRFKTMRTSLR